MWIGILWKKVLLKDEKKNMLNSFTIGNVVWERDMISEGKRDGNFEKN